MEGKIAVFGSDDFVMPFATLGADVYPAGESIDELLATSREIVKNNYAMIVLSEDIAEQVDEVFSLSQSQATPCVVVVPFTGSSSGFATSSLGDALKMATGINILQDS